MVHEYKVGDRVICIKDYDIGGPLFVGMTGTVCVPKEQTFSDSIGVCWDSVLPNGHDCDEQCEYGRGWFVRDFHIKLYLDDLEEIDIETNDIMSLILTEE